MHSQKRQQNSANDDGMPAHSGMPSFAIEIVGCRLLEGTRFICPGEVMTPKILLLFLFSTLFNPVSVLAAIREYHLTVAQEQVVIQDKQAEGMTLNGRIPGPTLFFNKGDLARIHVVNQMDVPTSIHWHGVLVPPGMDGVPFVTQPPISPGATFIYEFPIRQTGTYWYHSHSNLQEQSGLYGAIVIADEENIQHTDHDRVVLLSDWTTDDPHEVLRTLKRGSEWFALEKGSAQSILGAAKTGRLGDYFYRELQRMPPMDIADVAYDYFLANGRPEIALPAKPGETVRLRLIDGSATTFFHLEYAGGPMTIISADGQLVDPVDHSRFLVGVAETYDVLIRVPDVGAYELRATAHDGSGHASIWIGSGNRHPAPDMPKPNLYQGMHRGRLADLLSLTPAGTMGMPDALVEEGRFDHPGMMEMHDMGGSDAEHAPEHRRPMMEKSHGTGLKPTPHRNHSPPSEPETMTTEGMHGQHDLPLSAMVEKQPEAHGPSRVISGRQYGRRFGLLSTDIASREQLAPEGSMQRPGTPYPSLRSTRPSTLPGKRPVREIRLTLDGDMKRYVWFLNNKPLSETDHILINEGEIVRFIMINRTMMHHPMHLHGHFFRVINGQGDHAPLKHTVDVAPMSTTIIEFYGNEVGDWFFHCHLLYHMKSGMANFVHYQDFQPGAEVLQVRPELYRDPWYTWADADFLSNMTKGALSLSNTRTLFDAVWEVGWHKVEETDWEGLFTLGRYRNRFTSFFAGIDVLGEGSDTEDLRGLLGLKYLLPLNLDFAVWVDTEAGARVMLEKDLDLTPRMSLHGEVEYDTHDNWEGAVGLHYLLTKDLSLVGKWHSEFGFGGGISLAF
jgi:hypothetical protein